jgi:hypothetical protein
MVPISPDRSFGIEIEVFDLFYGTLIPPYGGIVPNHLNPLADELISAGIDLGKEPSQWRFVQDTSIVGKGAIEIVSPPLFGTEGLRQIEVVCQILRNGGARVDNSCGLHVHHDASDFGCQELRRLIQLVNRWEEVIYYCLPLERRTNKTCRPMEVDLAALAIPCGNGCDLDCRMKRVWYSENNRYDGKGYKYCKTRYHGLNLHAYWTLGTIEFRYPPSTLEAERIHGWIGLTQALVEKALNGAGTCPTAELQWEFEHLMEWLSATD